MVTYSLRRTRLQVRFLAPHPIFVLLAILLITVPSAAADQQVSVGDVNHYAAAPDSLVVAAASSDSLARVVGGDVFGVYWSSFGGNGQITSIDGVSMKGRADGVQDLATATYSTFKGVEAAIASSSSESAGWLEQILGQLTNIYNTLHPVNSTGSVYGHLDEMLKIFSEQTSGYMWFNGQSGVWDPGSSLPAAVGHLNTTLSNGLLVSNYLDIYGESAVGQRGLAYVTGRGFLGLSHLLFGSSGRDIVGLASDGKEMVGQRGSLSLAAISANGFSGLATLVSGPTAHRGNYVWLGQAGYEANGSTSLMDMVGEGFLGLSSLFSDTASGEARLSWMYVSPDDGLSGTQLRHNTLFSFLGSFASGVQNPLARLAYVLADSDDIALKQQEQPNMDAVKDSFFGDGEAAVNPGQIKDVAGLSSSVKDSFAGAGSSGDAFVAINDSNSYWFFSQEVADDLDTVNVPAAYSDDPESVLDRFVQDEDGFYSLIDMSPWDVTSYLGGG